MSTNNKNNNEGKSVTNQQANQKNPSKNRNTMKKNRSRCLFQNPISINTKINALLKENFSANFFLNKLNGILPSKNTTNTSPVKTKALNKEISPKKNPKKKGKREKIEINIAQDEIGIEQESKEEGQVIYLLNYDRKKFPNHPRTLYFKNEFSSLPKGMEFIDESDFKNKLKNSLKIKRKKDIKGNWIQKISLTNKDYFLALKTFRICYTCVKKTFSSNNFIFLNDIKNNNLIWVDPNKDFFSYFKNISKYQKFNHFPFSLEIELKNNLYKHYIEMKNKFPEDYNYMIESYILPEEREKFLKRILCNEKNSMGIEEKYYTLTPDNMWILKPFGLFGGEGIKIMSKLEDIPEKCLAVKYLADPYLINGKKIDLRLYALVTGFKPLRIYIYQDGIVRFASQNYNVNTNELDNLFIHLTNVCINRKFTPSGKTQKWLFKDFVKYLYLEKGINFGKNYEIIKDMIIKLFISITDLAIKELSRSYFNTTNLFEFFGFDIILDKNLNPYLLEINNNPMLNSAKNLDQEMKTKLISDIANIIGIVPFNKKSPEINLDNKEPSYKNSVDEAVQECLCEFSRPQGDWLRIFPLKYNIDYYSRFIENPGKENLKLWEILKKDS